MTRAQVGFIMVGDATTLLQRDPGCTWNPFFRMFKKRHWLCGDDFVSFKSTSRVHAKAPTDRIKPIRYPIAGSALSSKCTFDHDDAKAFACQYKLHIPRLLQMEAFHRVLDKVLQLQTHKYRMDDRQDDAAAYD